MSTHAHPDRSGPTPPSPPLECADETLRLVHYHPGYLRVRAGEFLKDPSPVATAARKAAEDSPGFRSWSANPKTGSVVIQYDPATVEADDLLKHIAACAGLRGVEVATRTKMNRQEVASRFMDLVKGVNQAVDELTGGRADLRELGPAALVAISIVSFIINDNRGRWPQWSTALYHSYRVFMHWHRPEIRGRERIGREEDERAAFAEASLDVLD
ncbi:MAG TPA: hypothetical protein VMG40_17400 [Bryobacteraceae bacterium]|jgi:hypothetical protein|nr:hypothetical protein [Bryobacteraceae bacterium]